MVSAMATTPWERAEKDLAALENEIAKEGTEGDQTPPEPTGQDEPPQEPATPPQETPQDDPNGQTYKARWESLQGMWRRQEEKLAELTEQNQALAQRIQQILAQGPTQQQAPPSGAKDLNAHLDKLAEEYGGDFIDALDTYVEARIGTKLNTLEQRLQTLNELPEKLESLEKDRLRERSEQFQAALTGQMADWQEILNNDDFELWAKTTAEPFTGETFEELFNRANTNWNLNGMLGVFRAYKEARGLSTKPSSPATTAPTQDPRASLITPGGKGAGTAATPEPKIWKSSEVDAFFRNYGKYSAEDAMRVEADIMRANAEGRIVPG